MKKGILMVCEFVFFFTGFFLMFGLSVNAYIDPSVVTYTIQIGAGVVIAIGAAITIYYRKAKKKISDKLGIDENRNKEVESDEILNEILNEVEEEKVEKVEKEEKKEENPKKETKKAEAKEVKNTKTETKKKTTKKPAKKTTTKKTK